MRSLFRMLLLLTGVVAAAWAARDRLAGPPAPLELGYWYWHSPFRLAPPEVAQLEALGVRQLYVRAGTLRRAGESVVSILPQHWASAAGNLRVHLVFNCDYDVVRAFESLSLDAVAAVVRDAARREAERASKAGLHVAGLQIDLDCPTRLLPRYAELLRRTRHGLSLPGCERPTLSVTALPTWFTADEVQQVVDAVDFAVPQYYEADVPRTLDRFATVSRPALMERSLKAVARRRGAFYVGLPVYGHALLYDERGRLAGAYRDLSAADAARHPSLRLERAFASDAQGLPAAPAARVGGASPTSPAGVGEQILDFAVAGGRRRILYDLPMPEMLAQHLRLLRRQRPRNVRGAILFRYPEPGEEMALPLASVAAVLRGERAEPRLRVTIESAGAPWELIDTGRAAGRTPVELTVTVTNTGPAGTAFGPDAADIILALDRPGLEELEPGDFTEDLLLQPEGRGATPRRERSAAGPEPPAPTAAPDLLLGALRAGPRRANRVRLSLFHLGPGETARTGPIRIPADGAAHVWGVWRAAYAGGSAHTQGEMPPQSLHAEARRHP